MAETLAAQYATSIQDEIERLKEERRSIASEKEARKKKRGYGAAGVAAAQMEEEEGGGGRVRSQYGRSSTQESAQQQYRTQPTYDQYPQERNRPPPSGEDETTNQLLNAGVNAGVTYGANALFGGGASAAAAAGAGPSATAASIPATAAPAGWTASGAGTAAPTSSTLGAVAPWLAAAVIAYMSYQTYKGRSKIKKQTGTDLTSEEMGETAPYTSAWFANKLGGFGKTLRDINPVYQIDKMVWGSTKSDEQLYRDRVRHQWKKHGLVDENYQMKLADGSTFDIGKDGGATLTNLDGSTRRYKDIDWNNPLAAESVADVNPLGYVLTSGIGKDRTSSEIVGYLTNAVTANAKDRAQVDANISSLYRNAGFKNRQEVYASLDGLVEAGKINKEAADAYKQSVNKYLPDAEKPQEEQQQSRIDFDIPEEPRMDKRRMNSRVDFGFSPSGPRAGGASTGVNEYLSMLSNMQRGRNG